MIDKLKSISGKNKAIIAVLLLLVLVGSVVAISNFNFAEAHKTTEKVTAQKKDTKKTEVKKEKAKAEEKKAETKIDENKEETAKTEAKAEEKKSESTHKSAPANKPTVSKPSTGGSNSGASNSSTTPTQKPKQKVWIVDKPAWTETIQTPNYKLVIMVKVKTLTMGVQIMTYEEFTACNAIDPTPERCRGSWSEFGESVQDGYLTQTVNHPEEGHWEWR